MSMSLAATLANATAGVQVERISRDMPAAVALPGPEAVVPADPAASATATGSTWLTERKVHAVRAQWPIEDDSLRRVIMHWGSAVGIEVRWDSTRDYTITPEVRSGNFTGTFKDALFQLAQKYQMLSAPLLLEFSPDGTVLHVRDQEDPQ
ncbi:TcpQ domain-containing protein [Variovorax sp. CAN2819]|uniref:TcpQ domain-containing protein n=1 Tax=Variovorax sp. CAN15 TaxID=3046727 RepID=UPI0026470D6B|nr:TcpQ domain-containing protein [Variovorax sp. CAN15]MDN6885226.1 TcpQ domain-containing protein [Variovorax sp. CAN15]